MLRTRFRRIADVVPTFREVQPGDPDVLLFHDDVISGEDFGNRRWKHVSASASRLAGCSFEKSRIESAALGEGRKASLYVDCSFDNARIAFGPGGFARFERCTFRNTRLANWYCFAVELVDCTFSGELKKAIFNGSVPREDRRFVRRSRNEFRGNDFRDMTLIDVAFRSGIDLSLQRLPTDGYVFLADGRAQVAAAERALAAITDTSLRSEVAAILRAMRSELDEGQTQLLIRRADVSGTARGLALLWQLLASRAGTEG